MTPFVTPPQSQRLYASTMAIPDASTMFVRLRTKPMNVRKTRAVIATPSSVDESGDDAAEG